MNARIYFNKKHPECLPWCVHRDDTMTRQFTKHVRLLCYSVTHSNTEPSCQADNVLLVMNAEIVSESDDEIVIASARVR